MENSQQQEHFGYYLLRLLIWLGIFGFAVYGLKGLRYSPTVTVYSNYFVFAYLAIMVVSGFLFLRDIPHLRMEFKKLGSPIDSEGEGLTEVKN